MNRTFQFDVFLSHSSDDRKIAREIADRLQADGLRIWFDEWKILDKDSAPEKIAYGLEQSRVLVLLISVHAFGPDWASLESGTFRFRDPLSKERRFIPLRLDDVPLKASLIQFPHIDWQTSGSEEGYRKLLESCSPPVDPISVESESQDWFPSEKTFFLDNATLTYHYACTSDAKKVLAGDRDHKIRVWDLEQNTCLAELVGHERKVRSVAWSNDQRLALSGSEDKTVRLWEVDTRRCLRIFRGHQGGVTSATLSSDQSLALSGSADSTLRLWDINSKRCLHIFSGHTAGITGVSLSPDQRFALSGSSDRTVMLWELSSKRCLRVLEGHTSTVNCVAWSADQRRALSGSADATVRLWDIKTGRCLRVLEGHTSVVTDVEWSVDGRRAISGSADSTVRVWDMQIGRCTVILRCSAPVRGVTWSGRDRVVAADALGYVRVWDLSEVIHEAHDPEILVPDQVQYTNAKVLVVGESGAGKTGLTERLALRTFTPSYSTAGTWSTQWHMKDLPSQQGWEREVWLWDFGGQADQRLIHQLYVDRAALILLVFNADREVVIPGLREWQQALSHSIASDTPTLVVAGRIDVGLRFDRDKVRDYAQKSGFGYFETSSFDGRGCTELRIAIQDNIAWNELERRTSPAIWKRLKDEILQLRDEGEVLYTFKELRESLRQRLATSFQFADTDLETVVGLLDGPGIVKELGFGTYILLRPEWINVYAQAVIRTLRSDPHNLGCLPVRSIAEGDLIFQQLAGEIVEERRLSLREEPIVLQAMEQMLLERKLCLRQGGNLVFPSYCGVEKPAGPTPAKYFISYVFGGFLDDIYATLVARLVYCGAFELKELWRDAADFETLGERRTMGLKLLRNEDARGSLLVHYGSGVTSAEQVIFANYIHEHLMECATDTQRLRFHVCPHCDWPVKDNELALLLVEENGAKAKILCQRCQKSISLWDELEQRFASEEVRNKVVSLRNQDRFELDSRRKGKLLALEVAARITSADQKCFEIPASEDEGLDLEVEFTDADGKGTGKRIYLQLKAGNSHLERRKRDGAEVFRIKKQSWVEYWTKQDRPVLLVVGELPVKEYESRSGGNDRFSQIRWMEIGGILKAARGGDSREIKEIVFHGEGLDTMAVRGWRNRWG